MNVVEIAAIGLISSETLDPAETSSKCRARIVGKVEFRQGEGALFSIPRGTAEVEVTGLDTTFSWTEGNFHGLAAMPLANFCHYIIEGAIDLDECIASADMQLAQP